MPPMDVIHSIDTTSLLFLDVNQRKAVTWKQRDLAQWGLLTCNSLWVVDLMYLIGFCFSRSVGCPEVGYSGINVTGTVLFWVWKICAYFFGFEFCQANSSYAIQANRVFLGSKMSSLVFFWVHNIRSLCFFGCKILRSVGLPRHIYTWVTHLGLVVLSRRTKLLKVLLEWENSWKSDPFRSKGYVREYCSKSCKNLHHDHIPSLVHS